MSAKTPVDGLDGEAIISSSVSEPDRLIDILLEIASDISKLLMLHINILSYAGKLSMLLFFSYNNKKKLPKYLQAFF